VVSGHIAWSIRGVAACRSDGKISKRVIELVLNSTAVAQQSNSINGEADGGVDVATDNTLQSP
jgi:hypothetical protein